MNLSKLIFPAVLLFALFSCQEKNQGPDPRLQQPDHFKKVLEAHGDWKQWVDAKSLSFAMVHETTLEWDPPVPYPSDGKTYIWNESIQQWAEVEPAP